MDRLFRGDEQVSLTAGEHRSCQSKNTATDDHVLVVCGSV